MKLRNLAAAAAVAATVSAPVGAATINYFTAGSQDNIPGLTGFTTLGSDMDGMIVTACFTVLGCEQRVWADTGATSGGVSGTDWSLSVTGDTFNVDAWSFVFSPNQQIGQLVSILLDGGPFTLFDRTLPSEGTPGSAQGRDFDTPLATGVIDVTYIDPVAVIPADPVGDLYHSVRIEFLDLTGPRTSFTFSQDADNDARLLPEPGTLALLGLAGIGLALSRRRAR